MAMILALRASSSAGTGEAVEGAETGALGAFGAGFMVHSSSW
jgi:hypothetical protein